MIRRILIPLALLLVFSVDAWAQEDCVYGFKIYARDASGKAIENAKIEVVGVTKQDVLPPKLTTYAEKGGIYHLHGYGETTGDGDFRLKISAAGFQTYEQEFNFPQCELESYEVRLRPTGLTTKDDFERLFNVHGRVYDEGMKPIENAKIEAKSADGRIYQTSSNAYGFYTFDVPPGAMTIRVKDSRVPEIVFEKFQVGQNYTVLNVPVCLKCPGKESKN